jgi:LysR family nitrogen assimilation transcriptional regulator
MWTDRFRLDRATPILLMTLRQLRYFVEIARSPSLTSAAQRLNIAQPALSTHMATLESELGVRLFERHAKGMQLSEAGQRLYRRAVELLAEFDGLKADVTQTENSPAGRVRLCIDAATAGVVPAPLLRRVSAKYPRVELTIADGMSWDIRIALEKRAADMALMPGGVELAGLRAQPLFEERFMLFGAERDMRDLPDSVPVELLADLILAAPDRAHDARKMIERAAANAGIALNVRYELNSVPMLIGAVKEGLAHGILPTSICTDAIASGALSGRPIDSPLLVRTQAIVWPDDRPLSAAAAAVKAELADTVRDLVERGVLEGRLTPVALP